MLLRLATISDKENLRQLAEITFRDTYTAFNTAENMENHVAKNFSLQQIEAELQSPACQYIVIETNQELIGFAKLVKDHATDGLTEQKVVEIERIYVQKAYHGQQLGRQLINFCIDWSRENKFEVIWLGVWENNHKAIQFYEKMGFQNFGTHVFVLGEEVQTDFVMKKAL